MTIYVLGNVKVGCIESKLAKKKIFSVIALPAEESQRQSLGNAAVGQAWAVSTFKCRNPRQIKFMPPSYKKRDTKLLSQCFQQTISIANRLEQDSLGVVTPKVESSDQNEAIARSACEALVKKLPSLNHLRNICFLATDANEASQFDRSLRKLAVRYQEQERTLNDRLEA